MPIYTVELLAPIVLEDSRGSSGGEAFADFEVVADSKDQAKKLAEEKLKDEDFVGNLEWDASEGDDYLEDEDGGYGIDFDRVKIDRIEEG
jgi:hypothetical protein